MVVSQLQLREGSVAGERPDDLDDQPFWIFLFSFFVFFSFISFFFFILFSVFYFAGLCTPQQDRLSLLTGAVGGSLVWFGKLWSV